MIIKLEIFPIKLDFYNKIYLFQVSGLNNSISACGNFRCISLENFLRDRSNGFL